MQFSPEQKRISTTWCLSFLHSIFQHRKVCRFPIHTRESMRTYFWNMCAMYGVCVEGRSYTSYTLDILLGQVTVMVVRKRRKLRVTHQFSPQQSWLISKLFVTLPATISGSQSSRRGRKRRRRRRRRELTLQQVSNWVTGGQKKNGLSQACWGGGWVDSGQVWGFRQLIDWLTVFVGYSRP